MSCPTSFQTKRSLRNGYAQQSQCRPMTQAVGSDVHIDGSSPAPIGARSVIANRRSSAEHTAHAPTAGDALFDPRSVRLSHPQESFEPRDDPRLRDVERAGSSALMIVRPRVASTDSPRSRMKSRRSPWFVTHALPAMQVMRVVLDRRMRRIVRASM